MQEYDDTHNQLHKMGNVFFHTQQMSAQLAYFISLSLPLHWASLEFQFINTNIKESRAFILKSKEQLQKLASDSMDTTCATMIDKYGSRRNIEGIYLALFAAEYSYDKGILKDKK